MAAIVFLLCSCHIADIFEYVSQRACSQLSQPELMEVMSSLNQIQCKSQSGLSWQEGERGGTLPELLNGFEALDHKRKIV